MIVYGDRERLASVNDAVARVAASLVEAMQLDAPRRRDSTCRLAIECGMLVQALLDREHEASGIDALTPLAEAGAALCLAAGRAFLDGDLRRIEEPLAALRRSARAACTLRLREPEGYAFYALYPELYVEAARAWLERLGGPRDVQVIGIRSIGTSLAGFVAAALGSERLPFSVRPGGHPFARTLALDDALAARLLARSEHTRYAIVDEGPGLSGSSFVAVVEWLVAHGVAPSNVVLFPSHAGEPGAQSSEAVRARYRRTERAFVPFEAQFPPEVLGAWFSARTGPLSAPVQDLSGGRWRALQSTDPTRWPPSHVRDERRKLLLEADGARWLMKYVGLGGETSRIVERARMLGSEGLTPPIVDARHGFVLMPWYADATPLPRAPHDRAAFLEHLGRHLATLATRFSGAPKESGAAPDALLSLLKHNAAVLLGDERTASLARFDAALPQLAARHRPTATDNKLDAHEWLVLPDGRFLKCDAEAHHAAHDCIGCQDPAWDVAGATLELALTPEERDALCARLYDAANIRLDAPTLRFYELAYAAFRAGAAHYAVLALEGWADDDAARFHAEKARYAEALAARL